MDAVIETRGLTKDYGSFRALDRLDLEVPRGAVYGLLGRNGAGKTTAIRLLMGLLTPSGGEVTVLGGSPRDGDESRLDRIGYVSESMDIPPWMTVGEAAGFCRGLSRRWDSDYENRLYDALAIPPEAVVGHLSAGQRRKAGLLLALAPRPELLILDEPASSLDTVVRREFLEQAVELLSDEGTTIFYSSHILSDVERIADHVGVLSLGRLLLDQRLDDLLDSARRVRIRFAAEVPADFDLPGSVRTRRLGSEVQVTVIGFHEEHLADLPEGAKAEPMPIGLEDLFIDMVREEG
jgi:ABC-2 type transport system ATP-binding protein